MGFEILYSYHEQLDQGGYNTTEKKTMKKRVGDPFDEIDLDKCAGAILSQLARRDIWVTDVEVYELSKKKITFRESKGSVIIKNKKYQMDGTTASIISQEIEAAPVVAPVVAPAQTPTHMVVAQQQGNHPMVNGSHPHNRGSMKPIKWVIYQPTFPKDMDANQKRKFQLLRFTVDKKYPVFAEQLQLNGVGMAYRTVDDKNREQLVSDEYFIPAEPILHADRELRFSEGSQTDGGSLNWGGAYDDQSTPALR